MKDKAKLIAAILETAQAAARLKDLARRKSDPAVGFDAADLFFHLCFKSIKELRDLAIKMKIQP